MADALDDLLTITVGGTTLIDKALGYRANTVYVENYSNQYVSLPDIVSFVPPYTARLLALPGTMKARMLFASPPGTVQVASISGQVCNATWSERSVPVTGGPIGPIGVTSNYYDRNPLSKLLQSFIFNVAPHSTTVRWTYTVPASRKAFLELIQTFTELEGVGDLAVTAAAGFAESFVFVTPSGAAGISIVQAHVQDVAPARTRADVGVGASIELQPGDMVSGQTVNAYTATKATHFITVKLTEFDA